jgi:hypothetical protein
MTRKLSSANGFRLDVDHVDDADEPNEPPS